MASGRLTATTLLRRFFDLNTRLSMRLERALRVPTNAPLWKAFHTTVGEAIRALPPDATVVDLGGGRSSDYVPADRSSRLIVVDVSADEVELNAQADERIVADVARGLPLPEASVDLLISRTLFEHIADVPAAIENIARVLKPGGRTVHLMPGRYALFALVARLLPFGLLLRLLHFAMPETIGTVEFDVHYDHTEPASMRQLFAAAGFRRVTVDWTVAGQADYFKPVMPVYVLVVLYEALARALGLSQLAAYVLVCAER